MSYPPGIHEIFAYPTLQLNHSDPQVANLLRSGNTTTLKITLPVTRMSLDCSLIPRSKIYYGPATVRNLQGTYPGVGFVATHPLPKACQLSTGIWKDSSNLTISANFTTDYMDYTWAQPWYLILSSAELALADFPPDCPSIALTIGNYHNNTDNSGKMIFSCTQIQEEIPALLRFSIPSLTLDQSFEPQLNEAQAKKVSGYQYYEPGGLFPNSDFYTTWVEEFLGLSLDDMQGPENAELFLNASQHVFRLMMAMTIGDAMRVPASQLNSTNMVPTVTQAGTRFTGVIENRNVLRISQNRTSKIILQAFLSAMLACFVIAYPLVDTRSTLPHNPCSLAGTLSLLLGSRLSSKIRQSEQEGNSPGAVDHILADRKVKLGCWEAPEGGTARFGIDVSDTTSEP